MKNLIALDLFPPGGFRGVGTGPLADPGDGITTFSKLVSSIIGLMTIIAIIWFVFILFIGAFGIMTAGSDKQAAEAARKKISTGFVGLVVVFVALIIVRLIGYLLGIDDILDLNKMFGLIQI